MSFQGNRVPRVRIPPPPQFGPLHKGRQHQILGSPPQGATAAAGIPFHKGCRLSAFVSVPRGDRIVHFAGPPDDERQGKATAEKGSPERQFEPREIIAVPAVG